MFVAQSLLFFGFTNESKALISIFSRLTNYKIVGLISSDGADEECLSLHNYLSISKIDKEKFLCNETVDLFFVCDELSTDKHWSNFLSKLHIGRVVTFEETKLLCSIILPIYQDFLSAERNELKYYNALNACSEGIQIINEDGIIEFVNTAFCTITGIHASARLRKSIFDVSKKGAAQQVLRTGAPAKDVFVDVSGSSAKVVANGAPLIINGKQSGVVVLVQDSIDIIRLSKELQESKLKIASLKNELGHLKSSSYSFKDFVGSNKKLLEAINLAQFAAQNDLTVLITGESGTGKEIMAQAIHQAGQNRNKPFVVINCASIPDALIESELFGHEKGAFTGALQAKIGKFELAGNGTIFLDEIGDLGFNVQAKLLRVLQEKHFERVGSNECRICQAKVIAATNKNLAEMANCGQFRSDLFYRLQVIHVSLPPLRERKEDIPHLAEHLLLKIARKLDRDMPEIAKEAMDLLVGYSWPGNIRELGNVLTRAVMVNNTARLTVFAIKPLLINAAQVESLPNGKVTSLKDVEAQLVLNALKTYGATTEGKRAAAKALNISLTTLYSRIKYYNLTKPSILKSRENDC